MGYVFLSPLPSSPCVARAAVCEATRTQRGESGGRQETQRWRRSEPPLPLQRRLLWLVLGSHHHSRPPFPSSRSIARRRRPPPAVLYIVTDEYVAPPRVPALGPAPASASHPRLVIFPLALRPTATALRKQQQQVPMPCVRPCACTCLGRLDAHPPACAPFSAGAPMGSRPLRPTSMPSPRRACSSTRPFARLACAVGRPGPRQRTRTLVGVWTPTPYTPIRTHKLAHPRSPTPAHPTPPHLTAPSRMSFMSSRRPDTYNIW